MQLRLKRSERLINMYEQKILLTPGPLCTSAAVKNTMQVDMGTRDQEYGSVIDKLQQDILSLANVSQDEYAVVFLQGSGTYGVESVLTSAIGLKDNVLILANGAYGNRMKQIVEHGGLQHEYHAFDMLKQLPLVEIEEIIRNSSSTHVAFIHDETTAGVLNDVEAICKIAKKYHKKTIVDAMSSFGGIPINFENIDYLITSSNKCLHGVPGSAIIIARISEIALCQGNCKSLSLDLYEQYQTFVSGNGYRFTSPTHVMLALAQAIKELQESGGIEKRYVRYQALHQRITMLMQEEGFHTLVPFNMQAPIITTFAIPETFDFQEFYDYMKAHGILLYSGKLPGIEAFRIGNIGEISDKDIDELEYYVQAYCKGDRL